MKVKQNSGCKKAADFNEKNTTSAFKHREVWPCFALVLQPAAWGKEWIQLMPENCRSKSHTVCKEAEYEKRTAFTTQSWS